MVKGKARAAGSFLGGLANNPAIVIIALVLGGLLIFRKQIGQAFGDLGEGIFKITLPEINFPEFPKFPEFPEINFPDFGSFFDNFFKQQTEFFSSLAGQTIDTNGGTITIPPDTMIDPDTGIVTSDTPPIGTGGGATQQELDFAQARAGAFDTLFDLDVLSGAQIQQAISSIAFGDFPALNALIVSIQSLASEQSGLTPAQQFVADRDGFQVPATDPTGLGGGVSFMGGTTTFGDQSNLIDTLSEVLNIFPNLTASQAANALFANPNLTPNQFAQITPFQPSISSAGGDPEQIILNASGGFSGLTAQQIALILTGGNISNF